MPDSPAISNFTGRVLNYFGIRGGELRPTLWLAVYLMLGMASVICLKAVSDSEFLSVFDWKRLPYVDLVITVLVGIVVGLYLRLSNRFGQGRLIWMTQVFLSLNLLLFWFLLHEDVPGVPALVYVWVGVFAVLIPSQVWSLSSAIFTTRQAKRLFSLIGSGGILGAGLGALFVGVAGPRLGNENMLLATAGFVLACSAIVARLAPAASSFQASGGRPTQGRASFRESLRLVRRSRYLLLITIAIFLSTIAGTLVKYQFKAIAQTQLGGDTEALTSFFGNFYGYIAVLSFLFHTLLTARILRWIGLGPSLFILPSFLFLGTGVLFASSSLIAGIFARGADQAFRHSIDRSSIELLYVPIPAALRNRIKSFLDMMVSRSADGFTSVGLLLLFSLMQLEVHQISWLNLLFILPWLGVVCLLRGEYVRTLRGSIERRDISAEALLRNLAESAPEKRLELTLQGSDQRAIETAIDWMQFGAASAGQAQLASLLVHESSAIRRKAMAAIAMHGIPGCEREAARFLELEQDVDARWQALTYLESENPAKALASMNHLLGSADRDLAATAAAHALHHPEASRRAEETFTSYIDWASAAESSSRATAARLIGLAPPMEELKSRLSRFLRDGDPAVVRAALQSAATIKPADEIPVIVGMLSNRKLRNEARQALAAFGEDILETLARALRDSSLDVRARREIPRIIGTIGGAKAARLLLAHLDVTDHSTRYQILRALLRIRREQPDVSFDSAAASRLAVEELRRYYQEAVLLDGVPAGNSMPGGSFLRRALTERLHQRLDSIFRLLALIYPQREILDAYHWVISGRPELRSNALEFLDSRLDHPLREMLLPALEDVGSERIFEAARQLFGLERTPYSDVLRRLLETPDPWLRSLASYAAAEAGMSNLRPSLERLALDEDPLVAESAALARSRLQPPGGRGGRSGTQSGG